MKKVCKKAGIWGILLGIMLFAVGFTLQATTVETQAAAITGFRTINGKTYYYKNGKKKWHGKYVNGKREGYFTLQLREGGVAVVQFKNGKSVHDYFMVTYKDGSSEKRNLSELKQFM